MLGNAKHCFAFVICVNGPPKARINGSVPMTSKNGVDHAAHSISAITKINRDAKEIKAMILSGRFLSLTAHCNKICILQTDFHFSEFSAGCFHVSLWGLFRGVVSVSPLVNLLLEQLKLLLRSNAF